MRARCRPAVSGPGGPGEARVRLWWCQAAGPDAAPHEQHGARRITEDLGPGLAETLALPAIREPDDERRGSRGRLEHADRPSPVSSVSARTPAPRCSASDALASRRLASREPSRLRTPSSVTAPWPSQAPSSADAQSWLWPKKGTSTGPAPERWSPDSIATSQAAARRTVAVRSSISGVEGAASSRIAASCSAARRTVSPAGSSVVNAATRALGAAARSRAVVPGASR